MVHFLIKSGRVSADYVDGDQRSLVFLAVLHKRLSVLNLLLTHVSSNDADINNYYWYESYYCDIVITHTQPDIRPFVRDYHHGPVPVPEETFTHSHPSCSSDILYQLPPSTTIHSILLVQFMCLTVLFHNLSLGPLWSTCLSRTLYFILHTFLHRSLSTFCNTCPYCRNLFCCSTEIVSSIPYLSQLITWKSVFYLNATHPSDHSHLCSLKCHLIFSCRTSLTVT